MRPKLKTAYPGSAAPVPIFPLLFLLGLLGALPASAQPEAKAETAQRVFTDLVRAMGDGRTPPELVLVSDHTGGDVQVAFYDPQQNTVSLEERAYDLCIAQGPDSLDALASLLGHELAHYYKDHGWVGDFGSGFADLQVGKTLKKLRRHAGKLVEIETEADFFGGLFGYVAGYNTLGATPALLDAIYAEYELEDRLHGYPPLPERRQIAARSQQQLANLIPVFELGRQLLLIGHHLQAARAFDYIARTFPSREILNNSAVARALAAMELLGDQPLAYPFEIDAHTRLQRGKSRSDADPRTAQRLLEDARGLFELAARKDPAYATAYTNLACIAALQDATAQALLYAETALALAQQSGEPLPLANAYIARGIARLQQDSPQPELARADFQRAQNANPAMAHLNLAGLEGTPLPAARPARPNPPEPLPFAAETIRDNYDLVVELPGDQDRAFLFVKETTHWRALLLDTGESTIAFVSTQAGFAGATVQQIRLGTSGNQIAADYGAPQRHIAGRQATYHIYEKPRIIFHTDAQDRVAGWTLYEVEDLFYKPSPQLDQPRPAPQAKLGLVSSRVDIANEPRHALVIGNGAYPNAPLDNSPNDAQAMATALEETGFTVTLLTDADHDRMRQAIRTFGDQLGQGGVGLFYYAGHGVQVDEQNFLVPIDADLSRPDELEDSCILASAISRKMERAQNRVNILILDACRNNPFTGRYRSQAMGLAGMDATIGSLVAYATAPGKVAADGSGQNGLYTAHLLEHLKTPGLKIHDLFMRVRNAVRGASNGQQIPWESSSLTGDFYFVPPAEMVAQNQAAPPDEMVQIGDFYLDTYEVTNAAFADFLNKAGNQREGGVPWLDSGDEDALIQERDGRFSARPGYAYHPVVEVTWYGARAFCQWAGKRLPADAEWSYSGVYPWGNDAPDSGETYRANYAGGDDGFAGLAPVGSFPQGASVHGAQDLAGNVWEWVDAPKGHRQRLRGGSYFNDEQYLQGDHFYWSDPSLSFDHVGFRCAR
ncbi:MAG: SUMF1/EgtB/PvdO family nonheme iron enzyme [Candidatus Latescibacteria bacterium]|nr:SUMF1/EgtB/PvdO family nonheme iron enzyme [Candidatus Latescibacterota bacterium]